MNPDSNSSNNMFSIYAMLSSETSHMSMEHQSQSLHYFQYYAALDRVDFHHLSNSEPIGNVSELAGPPWSELLVLSPVACSSLLFDGSSQACDKGIGAQIGYKLRVDTGFSCRGPA